MAAVDVLVGYDVYMPSQATTYGQHIVANYVVYSICEVLSLLIPAFLIYCNSLHYFIIF